MNNYNYCYVINVYKITDITETVGNKTKTQRA